MLSYIFWQIQWNWYQIQRMCSIILIFLLHLIKKELFLSKLNFISCKKWYSEQREKLYFLYHFCKNSREYNVWYIFLHKHQHLFDMKFINQISSMWLIPFGLNCCCSSIRLVRHRHSLKIWHCVIRQMSKINRFRNECH